MESPHIIREVLTNHIYKPFSCNEKTSPAQCGMVIKIYVNMYKSIRMHQAGFRSNSDPHSVGTVQTSVCVESTNGETR